jgi:hypothetical protein
MMNNEFTNNTAVYGPNIASYPVKIMEIKGSEIQEISILNNIPSGEEIESPLYFGIVDVSETKIVNSINTGSILVSPVTEGASVLGSNTAALVKGRTTFSNIIFKSSPGAKNVKFKISTTQINYRKIQFLNSEKYADQILTVNFRW